MFGKYRLLAELGRGAQGVVHLAEDTVLGRKVAVKMLLGSGVGTKDVRDRFEREARLTSKLDHPGICGLHEIGEVEGVPFIAMQYVRGTTLADLVDQARGAAPSPGQMTTTVSVTGRSSRGDMQDVVRLIERAARALHAAHEVGLVHRDIKPGNIMVTPDGDPVLLDFGLARDITEAGQTLTRSGQIMGTPAYLAPEQIIAERGGIDRRTDVYALGVTLFECLTLVRPYDGKTWDQLFHQILHGTAPNPRSLNSRIPQDLRTVIEVAMEREPRRRYQTAEEFAEDLRRVRAFEPIRAKAAGVLVRAGKWARRHPGRAASLAAVALFASVGSGVLLVQAAQGRARVREHLSQAGDRLAAGDFTAALEAVAQARSWDPESASAVELRAEIERRQADASAAEARRAASEQAARARAESIASEQQYANALDAARAQRAELEQQHSALGIRFASDAERGAVARREREVRRLEVEAERLVAEAEAALERAARFEAPFGGPSPATERAFASFYLRRWREALANEDSTRAILLREAVEAHDREGRHAEELLGRGKLAVCATPPAAELYLFRWEDYDTLRDDDPVPRLVPVPTSGLGRLRPAAWTRSFHPGDPCLAITAVAPDSPAAAAGVRPGDLVLGIGDAPATGIFVRTVASAGTFSSAVPLQRVSSINGEPVADLFDWLAIRSPRGEPDAIVLHDGIEIAVAGRSLLPCWTAAGIANGPASEQIRLQCLAGGEPVEVVLEPGETAGLSCEATALPLVCHPDNRIAPGVPSTIDAGSYLLVARAAGFATQRLPFVVGRGQSVDVACHLLPESAVPPGFVHVPAGPFQRGGDPLAYRPVQLESVELDGFFIAKFEVSNREWFEFLMDPAVQAELAEDAQGVLVPRHDKPLFRLRVDGSGYEFVGDSPPGGFLVPTPESPALGLSWEDVQRYLAWRNGRAAAAGEPWTYDLPSQDQYEKAARGIDGRAFPWGDRFDPSLTVCQWRSRYYLLYAPVGFECRDESVYGVRDLAGSCEEWLRDPGLGRRTYCKRGGNWASSVQPPFRAASRGEAGDVRATSTQGFRLVARPR